MILYKNVDICDLESIMENGILSMDECGNDNWERGKRGKNSTSVVYLFKPIGERNTFPNYGAALLEVDVDAKENEMLEYDGNKEYYKEYIVSKVAPDQIKKIIIPRIFKSRITLSEGIDVTWCDFYAETYKDTYESESEFVCTPITKEELKTFAQTAPLNTNEYCYFKAINEDHTVNFLYNVKYIW